MKEIIRQMLDKAYEEADLELASIASDLMFKLASTSNASSNWRSITEELFAEYQDNEWIMESVFEFKLLADYEEQEASIMFKIGMTITKVMEKMQNRYWCKFHQRIDFENGCTNLIYYNGDDTICFYFDEDGRLANYR